MSDLVKNTKKSFSHDAAHMKCDVNYIGVFTCLFVSSEEISHLLTRPESEDGDFIPNFRPGKHYLICALVTR